MATDDSLMAMLVEMLGTGAEVEVHPHDESIPVFPHPEWRRITLLAYLVDDEDFGETVLQYHPADRRIPHLDAGGFWRRRRST